MMVNGTGKRLMSDINVVPFVDVMLVLLIIFMVAAPMMMEGVEVDLPQTTAKSIKTEEEPLFLSINKGGEIFLDEYQMKLEELESRIQTISKYRRDKGILLRADRDVPYGFVIQVISRLKRAGIEKLGMVTEPED
ncbi:MAG: protein TolR [Thermodesulfobacteriota bacterium]